jgi:hypothetical protein
MNRLQLTGLLAFFAIVYGLMLLAVGIYIEATALQYFSAAAGIVAIGLGAFERWLWKVPLLHPWLVPTPDISGTWEGRLTSSHDGQIGDQFRHCYLIVRQTFSRVSVGLITEESESRDIAAAIFRDNADGQAIAVTYQSIAQLRYRDRSPMQRGGMVLHIRGDPPYQLDGEYWTSQRTVGQIEFRRRARQPSSTYREAAARFSAES